MEGVWEVGSCSSYVLANYSCQSGQALNSSRMSAKTSAANALSGESRSVWGWDVRPAPKLFDPLDVMRLATFMNCSTF